MIRIGSFADNDDDDNNNNNDNETTIMPGGQQREKEKRSSALCRLTTYTDHPRDGLTLQFFTEFFSFLGTCNCSIHDSRPQLSSLQSLQPRTRTQRSFDL